MYITIHTVVHDFGPRGPTIEIELCSGVSNYQIDMKRIRITSTEQVTVMGNALQINNFAIGVGL